jgi:hypothetical protein
MNCSYILIKYPDNINPPEYIIMTIKNNKFKIYLKPLVCEYNKGIEQNNVTMVMKCTECNEAKTFLDDNECKYNCTNKFSYFISDYQKICSNDCVINNIQLNIMNNSTCSKKCEDDYGIKNKNGYTCGECNYPNILIEDICVFDTSLCQSSIMGVTNSSGKLICKPKDEINEGKDPSEICENQGNYDESDKRCICSNDFYGSYCSVPSGNLDSFVKDAIKEYFPYNENDKEKQKMDINIQTFTMVENLLTVIEQIKKNNINKITDFFNPNVTKRMRKVIKNTFTSELNEINTLGDDSYNMKGKNILLLSKLIFKLYYEYDLFGQKKNTLRDLESTEDPEKYEDLKNIYENSKAIFTESVKYIKNHDRDSSYYFEEDPDGKLYTFQSYLQGNQEQLQNYINTSIKKGLKLI